MNKQQNDIRTFPLIKTLKEAILHFLDTDKPCLVDAPRGRMICYNLHQANVAINTPKQKVVRNKVRPITIKL